MAKKINWPKKMAKKNGNANGQVITFVFLAQ